MRKLLAALLRRFQNWHYTYVGSLPEGYPLPGSEFMYNGKVGYIQYYVVVIHDMNETAEIWAVVFFDGMDLIYSPKQIGVKASSYTVIL